MLTYAKDGRWRPAPWTPGQMNDRAAQLRKDAELLLKEAKELEAEAAKAPPGG